MPAHASLTESDASCKKLSAYFLCLTQYIRKFMRMDRGFFEFLSSKRLNFACILYYFMLYLISHGSMVKWLRLRPLTAATRVRIPVESP